MWRDELKKAGMEASIPKAAVADEGPDAAEAFYEKVKRLMNACGMAPDSIEGPMPMENWKGAKKPPEPGMDMDKMKANHKPSSVAVAIKVKS
jgi:hypothetical protein